MSGGDAAKGREFPRMVTLRDQRVPLSYVCTLLRNCIDVLPGFYYDHLAEGPKSRSYAAAARWEAKAA